MEENTNALDPAINQEVQNKKMVAGILAILLGGLGIHKFYLGYTMAGLIMILVSILSLGFLAWIMSIIGIVEGIIYLTKPNDQFKSTYMDNKRSWF